MILRRVIYNVNISYVFCAALCIYTCYSPFHSFFIDCTFLLSILFVPSSKHITNVEPRWKAFVVNTSEYNVMDINRFTYIQTQ